MRWRSRTVGVTGHRFRRGRNDRWSVSHPPAASRRPVYNGWRTMRTSRPSSRRSGVSSVAVTNLEIGAEHRAGARATARFTATACGAMRPAGLFATGSPAPRRAIACRRVVTRWPRQDRNAMPRTIRVSVLQVGAGASGKSPGIGEPSAESSHGLPLGTRPTGASPAVVHRSDGPSLPHATRPVAGYPAGFGRQLPTCLPRTCEEAP